MCPAPVRIYAATAEEKHGAEEKEIRAARSEDVSGRAAARRAVGTDQLDWQFW